MTSVCSYAQGRDVQLNSTEKLGDEPVVILPVHVSTLSSEQISKYYEMTVTFLHGRRKRKASLPPDCKQIPLVREERVLTPYYPVIFQGERIWVTLKGCIVPRFRGYLLPHYASV
jgi:hypothetical protein